MAKEKEIVEQERDRKKKSAETAHYDKMKKHNEGVFERHKEKISQKKNAKDEKERMAYKSPAKGSDLFRKMNPHLQYDANNNPIYPEKSFFEGAPGYHINMPTLTEQQQGFADYLTSTVQSQLPDLINQMKQPVSMDLFSHMTNPILQKMANPQVLFPSQMQNQTYSGLEGLLGQLGGQAAQYGIENAPALYQGAKGLGSQALQYGQQAGGNIMDLLSGLANRFRPQQ